MKKIVRNKTTITVLSLILLTILSLHLAPVSFDALLIKNHKAYIYEKYFNKLIDVNGAYAPGFANCPYLLEYDITDIEWKGRNVYCTVSTLPDSCTCPNDTYHFTGKRYWIGKYKWMLEDS